MPPSVDIDTPPITSGGPFPVVAHPFRADSPMCCAYELGSSPCRNALVFIGGLGDGPHTVPYVRTIASQLEAAGDLSYSVFDVCMRSSFSACGLRRLGDDVDDLFCLVEYLRSIGKQKIVLMGHSTGCQARLHSLRFALHPAPNRLI